MSVADPDVSENVTTMVDDITEGEDVKKFLDRHEELLSQNTRDDARKAITRARAVMASVPTPVYIVLLLLVIILILLGLPIAGLAMWNIIQTPVMRDRFIHIAFMGVFSLGGIFVFYLVLIMLTS